MRLKIEGAELARPRKPTHLHVVQGTLNATRHANRSDPEVTTAVGDAPSDWPEPAKVIWTEIVKMVPAGVAGHSDRLIIELCVRLTIQMRSKGKFTAAVAAQLRCCLAALGMTPSDRSRVVTGLSMSGGHSADLDEFFQ